MQIVETLPDERTAHPPEGELAPQLFVVLECDRPLSSPTRHALAGVQTVVVGRAATRTFERQAEGDKPTLVLGVPDARMSSAHFRIDLVGSAHMLRDTGSRNGTLVNGAPVRLAALSDGDLIEAGHSLFLYREAMASSGAALDAVASSPASAGLETLVPALATEFALLEAIARSAVPILLLGATGSGKEVVAQAIHRASGRVGALVPVNCAALPDALIETELFGHRRGAFSGATENRAGIVRSADAGTLFLDEVGDLPLASQPVLLRVLQDREVRPVGDTVSVKVDIRVIAATNRKLDELVARDEYRADLLARLSGHVVRLPALRERRCDIGLFVATFVRRFAGGGAESVSFTTAAARALFLHDWPMNARELERSIETALVLAKGAVIDLPHLPAELRSRPAAPESRPSSAEAPSSAAEEIPLSEEDARRRDALVTLLHEHRGNVSAVARTMGKGPTQIHRWLRRYGLTPRK